MSIEFEPVQLGPRRRRVDPTVLGALVVVVGLVVAIVKPWSPAPDPVTGGSAIGEAGATASATPPGPSAASTPTPVLPRVLQPVNTASFATWGRVRVAVEPHDAWGIRAIVARPIGLLAARGDLRYEEIWNPLAAAPAGPRTIDIEPNDRTVVAIGITFPAAHTPIDTRIWRIHPDGLEWVATQAIDPSPAGGGFLYRVVGGDGFTQNWPAGRYRVDVLVDGGVQRFGFTLPNRFEIVPNEPSEARTSAELIDPAGGALPDLPIGLFITASGVSIPLPAEEGPALTETGAWLDVDPGTRRAPRSRVATVFAPAATGIGVMLPPGSVVQRSDLRRLAPEPLPTDPELVADGPDAGPSTAHVLYRAPGEGAWSPGVYQLDIVWADRAGLHDQAWHLDLRPGPVGDVPSMLLAARRFARYAGSSGVVVGTAEPLEGGPRAVAIRLLRPEPGSGTRPPLRDRVPCAGTRVDGLAGVIGLAQPEDAAPVTVVARVLYEFNRSGEQPLLTAAGDVPGLTLITPAGDPPRPSDAYQLRVDDTTTPAGSSVCLSLRPAG